MDGMIFCKNIFGNVIISTRYTNIKSRLLGGIKEISYSQQFTIMNVKRQLMNVP